MKRYTRPNPGGHGYRVPLEFAGTFRIEGQGSACAAFGDLINRLGELEDAQEAEEKRKRLTR